MHIRLRRLTENEVNVELHSDQSVASLKDMIAAEVNIQKESQTFIFAGKVLDNTYDAATVAEVGMKDGSVVDLYKGVLKDEGRVRPMPETFELHIAISDGEDLVLWETPNTLIYRIKEDIESERQIPIADQKLYFEESALWNGRKLKYYGFPKLGGANSLVLARKSKEGGKEPTVQIWCKLLTGKSISLDICLDSGIDVLKARICEKAGVSTDQQRLIFGGHELQIDHTLRHYNIKEGHTVHMVLRLLGGIHTRCLLE